MRLLAIAVVFLVVATTGVAVAAGPTAWSPTLKDCVAGWNAAPGLPTTTTNRAEIAVVASYSIPVTGKTSPKAGRPGCMVSITQGDKRGLTILGRWSSRKTIEWRSPLPMSSFPKSTNAVMHPGGRITLR